VYVCVCVCGNSSSVFVWVHARVCMFVRTKEQLCNYRAAGHPVKKTWLAAIKPGEYATWPGLTYDLVAKHLTNIEETAMGHLHKRIQNI